MNREMEGKTSIKGEKSIIREREDNIKQLSCVQHE